MSSTLRIHVTLALILIYVTLTRALRRGGGSFRIASTYDAFDFGVHGAECADKNPNDNADRRRRRLEIVSLSVTKLHSLQYMYMYIQDPNRSSPNISKL